VDPDPDPHQFELLDPDPHPDPGGQKLPTNIEKKSKEFSCAGCSLLRAEGFSYSLCVLYGGLRISKLQFSIQKIFLTSFTALIFCNFWSSEPWIRNWIRIRIRIKSMRIQLGCLGTGTASPPRKQIVSLYYLFYS
jgi:hypothetical protein